MEAGRNGLRGINRLEGGKEATILDVMGTQKLQSWCVNTKKYSETDSCTNLTLIDVNSKFS